MWDAGIIDGSFTGFTTTLAPKSKFRIKSLGVWVAARSPSFCSASFLEAKPTHSKISPCRIKAGPRGGEHKTPQKQLWSVADGSQRWPPVVTASGDRQWWPACLHAGQGGEHSAEVFSAAQSAQS